MLGFSQASLIFVLIASTSVNHLFIRFSRFFFFFFKQILFINVFADINLMAEVIFLLKESLLKSKDLTPLICLKSFMLLSEQIKNTETKEWMKLNPYNPSSKHQNDMGVYTLSSSDVTF